MPSPISVYSAAAPEPFEAHDLESTPTSLRGLTSDPRALTLEPGSAKVRLIQLDVLRGIAVLMVFGRHMVIPPSHAGWFKGVANVWLRFGWTGVDLFFVLSGFLVSGLLFSELRGRSELNIGRFIVRRGLKIWPSYFVYIAFLFVLLAIESRFGPSEAPTGIFPTLLPNLVHLQNYLGTIRPHTWSLSVEEHFYLALPLVLWLLARQSEDPAVALDGLLAVSAAISSVCLGLRVVNFETEKPYSHWTHLFPTHLRMDSLFFGVMLGYLHHYRPDMLRRFTSSCGQLLLIGVTLVTPMMMWDLEKTPFVPIAGLTMLYLGFGCILIAVLYAPVEKGGFAKFFRSPAARLLAWAGLFSYPIYLWHWDTGLYAASVLSKLMASARLPNSMTWSCVMIVYIGVAIAVGVVMSKLVELPVLALRDRILPEPSAKLAHPRAAAQTHLAANR